MTNDNTHPPMIESHPHHESDCPVCNTAVAQKQTGAVVCASCGVPHHGECWSYNGKCGIFACGNEKPATQQIPSQLTCSDSLGIFLRAAAGVETEADKALAPSASLPSPAPEPEASPGVLQRVGNVVAAVGTSISDLPFSVADAIMEGPSSKAAAVRCFAKACVGETGFSISEMGKTPAVKASSGITNEGVNIWRITGVTIPGPKGLEDHTVELLPYRNDRPERIPQGYHSISLPEFAGLCRTLYRNRFTMDSRRALLVDFISSVITPAIFEYHHNPAGVYFPVEAPTCIRPTSYIRTDSIVIYDPAMHVKSIVHHPDQQQEITFPVEGPINDTSAFFEAAFGVKCQSPIGQEVKKGLEWITSSDNLTIEMIGSPSVYQQTIELAVINLHHNDRPRVISVRSIGTPPGSYGECHLAFRIVE